MFGMCALISASIAATALQRCSVAREGKVSCAGDEFGLWRADSVEPLRSLRRSVRCG